MTDRTNRLKETLGHIGVKSVAVALAVFFLVTGIAVHIGVNFYKTEKEVLLLRGELNARESAMEYERFLLTHADIITLVSHTVDDMLDAGEENSVIEAYITDKTKGIIATLAPSTTGLYGWFNGEYLDGAGWVPDEGYVATERPWYIETLRSDQAVTFVEPYLDVQTNTVLMTVSALLNDGESVLAMDVSLDAIQQIVESIASSTPGSQAFVLSREGVVVIHSEEEQLGRNYLDEPDSLGGAVARRLLIDGQTQFDVRTAEGRYSVYADELEGDWYSVSLINASVWYRPLQRTIIAFSLILLLIIAFLTFVFLRLSAKNLALERLHTRINQEEKRGKELQMLSETDRMTGLSDRVSGKRKVDELLAADGKGMFLELDIDHFKAINDTYGHRVGDEVILAVADAMRSTFRANDITMRLGGDEFGVFAVGIDGQELGEAIVRRLFAQLDKHEIAELRGEKICISVGAALCAEEEESSFDALYARADSALYISKKAVGNHLTFA